MRVVVSGGAGFIGIPLTDLLLKSGHEVLVIDTNSKQFEGKCSIAQVDVRSTEAIQALKNFGAESFIHLVAQKDVMTSVTNPLLDIDINVRASVALFEAAIDSGVQSIVFASSGGAIYSDQAPLPANENSEIKPKSPYGISKLATEQYLHAMGIERQVRTISMRMSNAFGPGDQVAGVIGKMSTLLLQNKSVTIYGDGSTTRDFIYVDDVARAFAAALSSDFSGSVNISSNTQISLIDLYREIAEIIGSELKPVFQPARSGEIERSQLDNRLAEKVLHWKPEISLQEGITRCIHAWR